MKVKIKQFRNKAKEPVAGLTPEHAIYDANGVRLDAKLGNINLQEFRDLQQQGVNVIKNQEAQSIQAVVAREAEILAKSDASKISTNAEGLEGSNVEEKLTDAGSKLAELEEGMNEITPKTIRKETQVSSSWNTAWENITLLKGKSYVFGASVDEQYASIIYIQIIEANTDTGLASFEIPVGSTQASSAEYLSDIDREVYIRTYAYGKKVTLSITPTKYITTDEIADSSIDSSKIKNGSIKTDNIEDGAVNYKKIRDGAILNSKLDNNSVSADKIQADAVTRTKIVNGAVSYNQIDANVRGFVGSTYTLGLNIQDGYAAIRNFKVYTKDRSILGSKFSITYFNYTSGGALYMRFLKDGSIYFDIERSNFTPTETVERILYGKDNNTIIEIIIDWSLAVSGQALNSEHVFSSTNIIYDVSSDIKVVNKNAQFLYDAIVYAKPRCLDVSDYDATYSANYVVKSATSFMMRVFKGASFNTYEKPLATGNEVLSFSIMDVDFIVDCSKIPNGTNLGSSIAFVVDYRDTIERNESSDGYAVKDTIDMNINVYYVDCNLPTNAAQKTFNTIKEACQYVTNISAWKHQKQYEIIIRPGVYEEMGIQVPPYTHVHGTSRTEVLVTNRKFVGQSGIESNIFDFGTDANVAWKNKGVSAKLSNMTLESHTGYCIHCDEANIDTAYIENVWMRNVYNASHSNNSIVGGGAFGGGKLYWYNNCVFEITNTSRIGEVAYHTKSGQVYGNSTYRLTNCTFINSKIKVQSIGGNGRYTCDIRDCKFTKGIESIFHQHTANGNYGYQYPSDLEEWNIIGGNNKNFTPKMDCEGYALAIESSVNGIGEIIASGSIVNALLGKPESRKGSNGKKSMLIGSLYVNDSYSKNAVTSMWSRLGDCSSTPKTMTISVNGGASQTITLNDNYVSTKPSEETIIASINSQLNDCVIKKIAISDSMSKVNTTEKEYIIAKSDIIKYACVDEDGNIVPQGSTKIYGIALADTANGDIIPVWIGRGIYVGLANGNYAVGANGTLVSSAENIVATCKGGIVTLVCNII